MTRSNHLSYLPVLVLGERCNRLSPDAPEVRSIRDVGTNRPPPHIKFSISRSCTAWSGFAGLYAELTARAA